ncbi:MAG: Branched-chain amino acid transport system / permease component [Firmicutes bacterium ADurb.Bin182]|nr:MAG: Branched-chain amino acid transport system / permease component [Firmicutes bacterium ADurb.Bin182]
MGKIIDMINAAVLAGTPLLFGTLGEILTEKSGNLNLGVEGMMFMGGVSGFAAAYLYNISAAQQTSGLIAVIFAILGAFAAGALGALIYSFLTVTLRANQNVTGLTLTIFGTGFGNFFGEHMAISSPGGFAAVDNTVKAAFGAVDIPVLSKIPYIGKLLFSYNFMVYLSVFTALLLAWFFYRTRYGLNLRAVGENPATADAAGINVTRYKYIATTIGGGICGLGGMYVVMVTCSGVWVHNSISGLGWIAVALVIFAAWDPYRALIGSLLFGGLSIMRLYVQLGIPMQIYDMLPFVGTVIVLILTSVRQSRQRSQPKSCGTNYFREER